MTSEELHVKKQLWYICFIFFTVPATFIFIIWTKVAKIFFKK